MTEPGLYFRNEPREMGAQADDELGIVWWNALTERERGAMVNGAGRRVGGIQKVHGSADREGGRAL